MIHGPMAIPVNPDDVSDKRSGLNVGWDNLNALPEGTRLSEFEIERVLGDRPLTILDPHSARTHLYLADPERFNLNLLNTTSAPAVSPGPGTAPNNEPLPANSGTEK